MSDSLSNSKMFKKHALFWKHFKYMIYDNDLRKQHRSESWHIVRSVVKINEQIMT